MPQELASCVRLNIVSSCARGSRRRLTSRNIHHISLFVDHCAYNTVKFLWEIKKSGKAKIYWKKISEKAYFSEKSALSLDVCQLHLEVYILENELIALLSRNNASARISLWMEACKGTDRVYVAYQTTLLMIILLEGNSFVIDQLSVKDSSNRWNEAYMSDLSELSMIIVFIVDRLVIGCDRQSVRGRKHLWQLTIALFKGGQVDNCPRLLVVIKVDHIGWLWGLTHWLVNRGYR